MTAGTKAFTDQWRKVASEDPDAFENAQHAYTARTHYSTTVGNVMKQTGFDVTKASPAVQDAVWSTSVQQGPYSPMVGEAVNEADKELSRDDLEYEKLLINNIHKARTAQFTTSRGKDTAKRDAAAKRGDRAAQRKFGQRVRTDNMVVVDRCPK